MRLRSMIAVGVLGFACCLPAQAEQRPDPVAQIESLLSSGILLQGVVRDEDVALLFAHIRAALLASYQGREAPLPDALNRRAEEIAGELKARGALAGLMLLATFEAAVRQALREAFPAPAPAAR